MEIAEVFRVIVTNEGKVHFTNCNHDIIVVMHPTNDDTVRTTPDDVPNNDLPNTNLNVLAYWSSTSAALLTVLAVCFALCSFSTDLESFLAQHLAIFFIAFAITLVVNACTHLPSFVCSHL